MFCSSQVGVQCSKKLTRPSSFLITLTCRITSQVIHTLHATSIHDPMSLMAYPSCAAAPARASEVLVMAMATRAQTALAFIAATAPAATGDQGDDGEIDRPHPPDRSCHTRHKAAVAAEHVTGLFREGRPKENPAKAIWANALWRGSRPPLRGGRAYTGAAEATLPGSPMFRNNRLSWGQGKNKARRFGCRRAISKGS
jgi:hypothetical protein